MTDLKPSLTVIIPAYLEEKNIRATVENVILAITGAGILDYEILIIDCSSQQGKNDATPQIADELAKTNERLRAIHNPYVSLGYKFWQGVDLARSEYVTWIPGDNETELETIKKIFRKVGQADIVCTYTANPEARPLNLRLFSGLYTFVINRLFGLNLRYFNGVVIYKTKLLKALPRSAKENISFSYNVEILVRLIKAGYNYIEIPQSIVRRERSRAKFLNPDYFYSRYDPLETVKRIVKLFWAIKIKKEL